MSTKSVVLKAALAGLAAGMANVSESQTAQAAPSKKGAETVQCYGVNSCKGHNGCAVDGEHIKVAKEAFGEQFAKSKAIDCAGNAECAAKNGILAWASKPTAAECFKEGGMVFEKVGNKLVIKNKSGIVTKG